LCEALRVFARYETPDSDGETRRKRNARFHQDSPAFFLPLGGEVLWEWFMDGSSLRRNQDGYPCRLTAPEWLGWAEMTGEQVRPEEWEILRAMDAAYVGALCSELSDQRARLADKPKPKGRR